MPWFKYSGAIYPLQYSLKVWASQEVTEDATKEGISYCVPRQFWVMIRDCLPPNILEFISIIITPKLYMSSLMETTSWIMYSGGIYPLQHSLKVWGIARRNIRCYKRLKEAIDYRVLRKNWVTIRDCLSWKILDKPKSVIFGTIVASINIFSGFRSRWIIWHVNPHKFPWLFQISCSTRDPETHLFKLIKTEKKRNQNTFTDYNRGTITESTPVRMV
jgi:hypothetical protein